MVKNHWSILIGLIIISAMLVTAAFSLGLYIGKRGLIEEGIQQGINQPRQTANNPQPAQNLPAQGTNNTSKTPLPQAQAQALQEEPDLTGRFINLENNLLVLNTPNGMRQVAVSEDTLLISPGNGEISWQELSRGSVLAVFGTLNEDTRQLEAQCILLLPQDQLQ